MSQVACSCVMPARGRSLSHADLDERPRSNPVIDGSAAQLTPAAGSHPHRRPPGVRGDIVAALAAYRMAAASPALASLARTRRLQFRLVLAPCHDEAASLAAELQKSRRGRSAALGAGRDCCGARSGRGCGRLYRNLAMAREQHPIVRALAYYAAARQLGASKPQAAVSLQPSKPRILTP